jgi:hypothetical protein
MSQRPLRPPATLPVHDRFGHLTCLIAQVEYMFSPEGRMPDLGEIDRAISRGPGEAPPNMGPATSYLLERGYTIRSQGPFNDEAFSKMTPDEAREYVWRWKGWPDDLRQYFEVSEYPLDRMPELQAAAGQWVERWRPYDYQWVEGEPTIADVVRAVANGAVVRAVYSSQELLNEVMTLVTSVPGRSPEAALLVYGWTRNGEAKEFTPEDLDQISCPAWGIEAITR